MRKHKKNSFESTKTWVLINGYTTEKDPERT